MMSEKDLFMKTLPFVWAKVALGAIVTGANLLMVLICIGLFKLFNNNGFVFFIAACGLVAGTEGFAKFLNSYVGYLIKAGHVAVVAEAMKTGKVPDDMINYGKDVVKKHFVQANVFFALDKMIDGAVSQISGTFGNIAHLLGLDLIPGFKDVKQLVDMYMKVALGNVDECCLGWCFVNEEQSPFKSSADGIVIYVQNWKAILTHALKSTLIGLAGCIVLGIVFVIPFYILVSLLSDGGIITLVVVYMAICIGRTAKTALLDSWNMVSMMTKFMEIAPQTELKFDLYQKLCGLSEKFKELFVKGGGTVQGEEQAEGGDAYADGEDAPLPHE